MKTEIRKSPCAEFEPFQIIIQIEQAYEAAILMQAIQRGLPEHDELRKKFEEELRRQNWEL